MPDNIAEVIALTLKLLSGDSSESFMREHYKPTPDGRSAIIDCRDLAPGYCLQEVGFASAVLARQGDTALSLTITKPLNEALVRLLHEHPELGHALKNMQANCRIWRNRGVTTGEDQARIDFCDRFEPAG